MNIANPNINNFKNYNRVAKEIVGSDKGKVDRPSNPENTTRYDTYK